MLSLSKLNNGVGFNVETTTTTPKNTYLFNQFYNNSNPSTFIGTTTQLKGNNASHSKQYIHQNNDYPTSWGLAIICVILTIFTHSAYLFVSARLNFQRNIYFTGNTFGDYYTDTYASFLWIISVFIPNLWLPILATSLFIRILLNFAYHNMLGLLPPPPSTLNNGNNTNNWKSKLEGLYTGFMYAHVVIAVISSGIFLTDIILLSVEATSCNSPITSVSNGANICNDIRYCGCEDVNPDPPNIITLGCPYIKNSFSVPLYTVDLVWDTYFKITFALSIWSFVLSLSHLIFVRMTHLPFFNESYE